MLCWLWLLRAWCDAVCLVEHTFWPAGEFGIFCKKITFPIKKGFDWHDVAWLLGCMCSLGSCSAPSPVGNAFLEFCVSRNEKTRQNFHFAGLIPATAQTKCARSLRDRKLLILILFFFAHVFYFHTTHTNDEGTRS